VQNDQSGRGGLDRPRAGYRGIGRSGFYFGLDSLQSSPNRENSRSTRRKKIVDSNHVSSVGLSGDIAVHPKVRNAGRNHRNSRSNARTAAVDRTVHEVRYLKGVEQVRQGARTTTAKSIQSPCARCDQYDKPLERCAIGGFEVSKPKQTTCKKFQQR